MQLLLQTLHCKTRVFANPLCSHYIQVYPIAFSQQISQIREKYERIVIDVQYYTKFLPFSRTKEIVIEKFDNCNKEYI